MRIEQEARDLLRGIGIPCEYYVPDEIPESLVTVKRTSTPRESLFSGVAMLTLQAWATSRGKAEALCGRAVDALVGRGEFEDLGGLMESVANVTGCTPENGPYRWDDPDVRDRKRWQATISINYNS